MSPGEDSLQERLRAGICLLVVVELDIGLVQERDVEIEREVSVAALGEGEARMPTVQIPLEPHVVLAEAAGVEVVAGSPGQGPVGSGTEPCIEAELLAPTVPLSEERAGQRAGRVRSGPVAGELHRHVKAAAGAAAGNRRIG